MDNEILKYHRRHFSNLGLMYFLGALIIIGVQLGVSGLITILAPSAFRDPDLSLLLSMLPSYAIAFPLMALLIRQVPRVQMKRHKLSPLQLLGAFAISYALMYVSNLAGQFITNIIGMLKNDPVANVIADIAKDLNPLTAILVFVILAPIMEEWIFRKLLVDRLIRYGEGTAILFSGLMFGLFHGNLNQLAYAFFVGAFWAFIYVKTGTICYTIILHMGLNFMGSVVSLFLLDSISTLDVHSVISGFQFLLGQFIPLIFIAAYTVIVLALVISGIVLIITNRNRFRLIPAELFIPKDKRFSVMILNTGMVLYILFWVAQIILQLFM